MKNETPETIAATIASAPYAWPGGYRIHAATDDGGCLCSNCCKSEAESISESDPGDGWHVVATFVHWEGEPLTCDHCGTAYPSEYGDD